MLLKLFS